jgi:hypothetical protein
MTGDHHGQTTKRATLLVTAADEILGRHRQSWTSTSRNRIARTGPGTCGHLT